MSTNHIGVKMEDGIPIPYVIETGAEIAYCNLKLISSVRDVLMLELTVQVHDETGCVMPVLKRENFDTTTLKG